MLYSIYPLYEGGMEIMIPEHLKVMDSMLDKQYAWMSNDKKILINVTLGANGFDNNNIIGKLNEYYQMYKRDVNSFKCEIIRKRDVNLRPYGEIRYNSRMMGYDFFNLMLLGVFEKKELMFTVQCIQEKAKENMHIFENIVESIKVRKG